MEILGIDIGGSGIKGAPVDTERGELLRDRFRIPTPEGAAPADVAAVVAEIVDHFTWRGLVGVGFPAVIQHGVARTAANIDKHWIGTNVEALLGEATGCRVRVINDADAAGMAEMRFGAGGWRPGSQYRVGPHRDGWSRRGVVGSGLGAQAREPEVEGVGAAVQPLP